MINVIKALNIRNARVELYETRADFYHSLASSLDDRVPIFTTLRKYEARARSRNPAHALVYMEMIKRLDKSGLASAIQIFGDDNEVLLIDSLQSVGDAGMADGLRFLSATVEKTDRMKQTARKAFSYPLALLVVFSALLTGFATSIVPVLIGILPPSKWPFMGKVLLFMSEIITGYGIFIVAGFVVTCIAFTYSLPNWTGPTRKAFDKFLPYRFYRDYSGAMLIISLSAQMKNGISLRTSIERSMKYGNRWLRMHLREILWRLARPQGKQAGEAFKTGCFNIYLEDRIEDAFERRNPVDSFVKIGVGSVDKIIEMMESSANKVSRTMVLVCGIILLVMMSGFFSTTMELQQGIKSSRGASPK